MYLLSSYRYFFVGTLLLIGTPMVFADRGEWLQKFYNSRGVCVTSATVDSITQDNSSLIVRLGVDPAHLVRIQRGGEEVVRDWLALHCPLPLLAFRNYLGNMDVVVQASDDSVLSCREFETSPYHRR